MLTVTIIQHSCLREVEVCCKFFVRMTSSPVTRNIDLGDTAEHKSSKLEMYTETSFVVFIRSRLAT